MPTRLRALLPVSLAIGLAACAEGAPPEPPGACSEGLAPRRVRLLTRREYDATVTELLARHGLAPGLGGAACDGDAACDVAEESCVAGACQADPCGLHTFVFPAAPGQYAGVVVAGTFNGWASTAAAGALALTWLPSKGAWVGKLALADGEHQYKLVADGTWLTDPTNPAHVPDGFGGENSALALACASEPPPAAASGFAAAFPVETRPEHFPFDDHEGAIVTRVAVEQHLLAGARVADVLAADLDGLLGCAPAEAGCLASFVEGFGALAFRRPLEPDEVSQYAALAAKFEPAVGVRAAVQAMLASPFFLYRFEVGAPDADGSYTLDPFELASELSYALWGSMPDDELFAAAADGSLAAPEVREAQARRLLADPRARPLLEAFAEQWLGTERLETIEKSPAAFVAWNAELAASAREGTRRFFSHVATEGRWDDLFVSPQGFVDERLAALYGLPPPAEPGLALAELPAERRAGVLGQAGVLAAHAHSDQTSPVRRGLFVRERLLCQTFGTPPANAGTVPEIDPDATTRERFAQHAQDPACSSCHRFIDPVGFGFERFDAIGAWREAENGLPIDASGDLTDAEAIGDDTSAPFATLPELGAILAGTQAARRCFVTQAFRFGFGALEEKGDGCGLEALLARFDASDHDVVELFVGLTQLPSFSRRRP